MHGRLKVRTSEEEKERKKKEQALKVKAYKHAMATIRAKRLHQEWDDEMLQLTTQLLLRNPDISTLWNIRRECVLYKADRHPLEDESVRQAVYDAELGVTEQCLMVNPKSYGAWHHRCWTLEHSPVANWQREVELCTKYLKLDERNFHTWDYRRYVVAKAGVEKQKELDFCTEKIKVNFSNYSSWHYRSLLLPVLHPCDGEALTKRSMSDTKLQEELEMVLTAAFTDPNDSSAWFYQRWLLGYSRPELEVCAFRCNAQKAVLALTNPIAGDGLKVTVCTNSGQIQLELSEWSSATDSKVDNTWRALMPEKQAALFTDNETCEMQVNADNFTSAKLSLKPWNDNLYYFNPPNRSFAFSAAVITELQTQLESCNSLLEFEPDSKWTLLTAALLMRAIDRQQYHEKSLQYIEKLHHVDALRVGYYKDLASKWLLEKLLADWAESDNIPQSIKLQDQPQLSAICYAQYMCIADNVLLPMGELEKRYASVQEQLKTFGQWQL